MNSTQVSVCWTLITMLVLAWLACVAAIAALLIHALGVVLGLLVLVSTHAVFPTAIAFLFLSIQSDAKASQA